MSINDKLKRIDIYKSELDKKRPFEGHLLDQIKKYYKVGLTYTSNAIEGNTLTESETKVLLEDGLTVGGKPFKDFLEAEGHAKAYDYMFSLINSDDITEDDILKMHYLFYNSIDPDNAGKYRDVDVIITGSNYPVCPVEEIQNQMQNLCKWAKENRDKYHPVVFGALLHKKLVFIHPFIDGNGRISRLIMNLALIQKRYMIAIIPPILIQEYINCLELAHKNDDKFIEFIADRVIETEKDNMRLLNIKIPKI